MTIPEEEQHVAAAIAELRVGDLVKVHPDSNQRRPWTVAARNDQHVILIRQAAFELRGVMEYCVTGWLNSMYNGEGPGPVRSSLNSLGGGWDMGENGSLAHTAIEALESGQRQLSMRRVCGIDRIEVLQVQRPSNRHLPQHLRERLSRGLLTGRPTVSQENHTLNDATPPPVPRPSAQADGN